MPYLNSFVLNQFSVSVLMVPRGGIEPPTQGFSVIPKIEQGADLESLARNISKKSSFGN
jgi:hypothetical protein